MNSRQQGDIGVASAILYFTRKNYPVSKPLTDSQRYDLVVDIDGKLFRVECKTATGLYPQKVECRTKGGNKSGQTTKKLSSQEFDFLFVTDLGEDGFNYLIPAADVCGQSTITLGAKYDKHRL